MSNIINTENKSIKWEICEVKSPDWEHPITVIAAKGIPYILHANRLQTLNVYLPKTDLIDHLVGNAFENLPDVQTNANQKILVHIHGGAWREPTLLADSIEPTVVYAFKYFDSQSPIKTIISLNYTLSQFPTHPGNPYDAVEDKHIDPAREAIHPQQVSDIYHALNFLHTIGLKNKSYFLSGHSAGACLAFQTTLVYPIYYDLQDIPTPPTPLATIGLNGLYDLPNLVYKPDSKHEVTIHDYKLMLQNAFGKDETIWEKASPARMNPNLISQKVKDGYIPNIVWIDQSPNDQLVSENQSDALETNLKRVEGLNIVIGHRCQGRHATIWQHGKMMWEIINDLYVKLLEE